MNVLHFESHAGRRLQILFRIWLPKNIHWSNYLLVEGCKFSLEFGYQKNIHWLGHKKRAVGEV